jgi:hypothetical protein
LNSYAEKPHWGHLYLDEGSSYLTVRDNWTATDQRLLNTKGFGVAWDNNGPVVPDAIRAAAGLDPAFRDLLTGLESSPAR